MSAISGTGSSSLASAAGFNTMSPQDFLKVMVSELKNQDPFQPQDSSKLLDQFSSIQNIQSQLNLQQSIQSLVLQNQVSAAGGMLNKYVTGLDDNNDQVKGVVTGVRVQGDKVLLDLDSGKSLQMSHVTQISTPPGGTATTTSPDATASPTDATSSLLSSLLPLLGLNNTGTTNNNTNSAPIMGPVQ